MKKRLISLALVLVLALSLLPVAALAADYDDFTDLKQNVWYTPYINFVLEKGYFIGMSDTEFAPNGTMTRAMFVTVIARMEGAEIDDSIEPSFPDVKANAWYTGSVEWAAANGIVEGYEDGTFRPGNYVTRQEMAAIMDRYINWRVLETGDSVVPGDKEVVFADQDEVDKSWAAETIKACVSYGLLEGYPDGTFGGKRNSTRAEVAAVIERLDWIIHGKDHIYRAVLNITDSIKEVTTKTVVKAEDLSAEYKDYITTLDKLVDDIKVADYIDATLVVGENVDGTRVVTAEAKTTLNENTIYNLVKVVSSYAVTLYGEGNQVTYDGVKEIVNAVKEDVSGLNLGFLSEMEVCEIAELIYSTVRGKTADVWTSNFKGAKGYYTGDITVAVGDYSYVIVVDEETGVSFPDWKAAAKGFAVALAKEVGKSFLAQAKDYTSSLTDIGAVIDITFSAGAYKEDTDLYAYNYPVDISLTFANEIDTFQYKINDGVYVKAYFSEAAQSQFKSKATAAIDAIVDSDAFQSEFNPAIEQAKESEEFVAIVDVIAEAQGEEAANKIVDGYITEWAKANATSKVAGDGEWKNESIYDLAYVIGGEIYGYVESELDARGLEMKAGITPEQLRANMETAGVTVDVDPALESYVIGVICDKSNAEKDVETSYAEEAAPAMKEYVDATVPAALEENEQFNKALDLAEKVRTALESVENLTSIRLGNVASILRNDTIQAFVAEQGADSVVARFAKYIEKVPAKAAVVFAGCTINEEAVIAIKDATTVAELCDIMADILEETGLADLTLADFAPEAGQNLTVSYGEKSATLNIVVEFEQ